MKRRVTLVLALVLACAVGAAAVFVLGGVSSAGPFPVIRAESASAEVSSTVNILLDVQGVAEPGAGSVTIDVNYDPAVVDATACETKPAGFDFASCEAALDTDTVRYISIDLAGVSGDFSLANITFHCVAEGTSALEVKVQQFDDNSAGPIDPPPTVEDGSVTCIAPTVLIDPPTQKVADSGTFDMRIHDVADLAGYGYLVNFDPSIIQVDSQSPGSFPTGCNIQVNTVDNTGGQIDFACITTPLIGQDGPDELLMTVNFTCTAPGTSPIDLKSVELTDSGAGPIDHEVMDGEVDCKPNAEPVVTAADLSGNEGKPVQEVASFTDPDVDKTHTCTVDYGDGSGERPGVVVEPVGEAPGTCTGPSHVYADNGVFTVTVCATDSSDMTGCGSATATIANVAPEVRPVTDTPDPSQVGEVVNASADFTDQGTNTHTCTIDWGDGTTTPGTITDANCSGSHAYESSGTFDIVITVTDGKGTSGSATEEHRVTPDGACPDFDEDGVITVRDLVQVARRMGTQEGVVTGNRRFPYDPVFDLNHDGAINVIDLGMVVHRFGEVCP